MIPQTMGSRLGVQQQRNYVSRDTQSGCSQRCPPIVQRYFTILYQVVGLGSVLPRDVGMLAENTTKMRIWRLAES